MEGTQLGRLGSIYHSVMNLSKLISVHLLMPTVDTQMYAKKLNGLSYGLYDKSSKEA